MKLMGGLGMQLNVNKTKKMIVSFSHQFSIRGSLQLAMGGQEDQSCKILGVIISNSLI